jgi:hypothetical protein
MTTTLALEAAPAELIDLSTRKPRFGTYVGSLPRIDFAAAGAATFESIVRGKRWMYVIIVSDEVVFCSAIVRLGYAANANAFAVDRSTGKAIADMTAMGPSLVATVSEHAGEGFEARFGLGSKQFSVDRAYGRKDYSVKIQGPRFKLDARMSTANAPDPISVVCELSGGRFSTTEKRALLDVEGTLSADGKKYDLKGAFGGYDYTAGLLERRTAWKWAFGMGRSASGKPLAYNLTEGFVGQRECVAWHGKEVVPLGETRFSFDKRDVVKPWKIQTGRGEVDFDATYLHEERHNLGVVRSSFQQIAGAFRGKLELPNETVAFEKIAGVTEDQDTLW